MKKRNRITVLNMMSTFILMGISVFTSPLFSRLLGTSGYGVMSTYTVWTNVMTILATLQTDATLIYAKVKYPQDEQIRYQSSVVTLSLSIFLALLALITLFIGPISALLKLSRGLVYMIMLQSLGSFGLNMLNTKFQYEFKAGYNMISSLTVVLFSLGLSLALVFSMPMEERYIGRILGNVISYGTLGICACCYILWKGRTFFNPEYWRFAIGLVLPLIFMNLSDLALGHSDLVMVRNYLGDSASGIYGLAYTFSGIMFAIYGALNKSWIPFFFDDMKFGRMELVSSKSSNFLELYTVLAMGFVLLTKEVFHVFADSSFWTGTGIIPVFVASYYLNFMCTFPITYEHFHMKVKVVSVVTVISAVLNIGLNIVFIRMMGLIGAAIATMLSHLFQFVMHQFYSEILIKEGVYPFTTKKICRYVFAFAAVMCIAVLFDSAWSVRWLLGAGIGVWELLRIRNRKVLI